MMNLSLVETDTEFAQPAEVAAETAPIHPDVAGMAERTIEAAAAKSALMLAEARASALTAVALAMHRGDQDPTVWRPADATAACNIAEMLIGVQSAAKVDLAPAFRQRSADADIAKGAEVANVLGGGGHGT